MKKVMVVIEVELHREYKMWAARIGVTMRDLMALVLKEGLKK